MKKIICYLGMFAGVALWCIPLSTQTSKADSDNTRAYFEVLRSQLNADKVATINQVLKLNDIEAKKFWPIYRNYEKELASIGDRKLEIVRDFFKYHNRGNLTNVHAKELAEKWIENLQERTDLWKKYHHEISDEVSPTRGAQFLQLENQIALFIDIGIASEMPIITPAAPAR